MTLMILAATLNPALADDVRLAPTGCETAIVWPELQPEPEAALIALVDPVETADGWVVPLPSWAPEGVVVDVASGERLGIVAPFFDERGIVAPFFDGLGIVAPFFDEASVIDPVYDGLEGVNPVPTPGATCIVWPEI